MMGNKSRKTKKFMAGVVAGLVVAVVMAESVVAVLKAKTGVAVLKAKTVVAVVMVVTRTRNSKRSRPKTSTGHDDAD
jgi:predicted small secreted protein